jgi:hypothetical protein
MPHPPPLRRKKDVNTIAKKILKNFDLFKRERRKKINESESEVSKGTLYDSLVCGA